LATRWGCGDQWMLFFVLCSSSFWSRLRGKSKLWMRCHLFFI
jgi:hypothetical protein